MAKERLYLYDTTLRDGVQTIGVDFSLEDKLLIAETLDALGVDYIEGGYPGANPVDTALFENRRLYKNADFTAFGMTKRAGRSISNDPGFQDVLRAECDAICLVAKSWDYHVRVALGITNEENLSGITESVKAVKEAGREPMLDCEHFFDGYKADKDYALACARAAYEEGARWVRLCDTNGGTLPVVGCHHRESNCFTRPLFKQITDGNEVAERFGHFLPFDLQVAIVHPQLRHLVGAVRAARLGDFILMVREYEIDPAAMNIKGLTQMLRRHGRTFDMPARPSRLGDPARAVPARLVFL